MYDFSNVYVVHRRALIDEVCDFDGVVGVVNGTVVASSIVVIEEIK